MSKISHTLNCCSSLETNTIQLFSHRAKIPQRFRQVTDNLRSLDM